MKKTHKLKIFLLILCLFFIEETVRFGISSIVSDEQEVASIEKTLVLNPSDAELHFRLARVYHLVMLSDGQKAQASYFNSLYLNPLLSSSWLGLAEFFADYGEKQKAFIALKRSAEVAPFYIARLWEGSILAFRLGFNSLAIDNLRIVAKTDPARRMSVIDLCWHLVGDPDFILNAIVTDEALPDYLRYLIVHEKLVETFPVWERMTKEGVVPNDVTFYYVDFLLRSGRSSEAVSIWNDLFGRRKADALVWNGGFETNPVGNGWGLDWKIRNVEGVRIDFDPFKRFQGIYSLRMKFDGEHNVDFNHVAQIVPVEPDTNYILASYMATRNVTTKSGISWEVYCYPRIDMREATEPLLETNDWTRVELSFHTTSDCGAVVISLRRYKSDKIDKYIAGTVWVDDVKLFKLGPSANAQSGKEDI
jgi:hypothetical protein